MAADLIERVKTGIEGLDKALNGGIPYKNVVLISGGAGTGKSTLCLQYIVNGAYMYGEKGLYISTEQSRDELAKSAQNFGWNIADLEQKGLLKIMYFDVTGGENFLAKLKAAYASMKPKRVAIDSLTTLSDSLLVSEMKDGTFSAVEVVENVSPIVRTEKIISKVMLYHLLHTLKSFDSTALLTSELPEKSDWLSADTISEFICDGVVMLNYLGVGSTESRTLQVRKMRYTDHQKDYLLYIIGKSGVEIKADDAAFKI